MPTGNYELLPFGYLYSAFAGLGIRSYYLDEFEAFLKAHDGHRLYQWSDHDDEFPEELDAILAARNAADEVEGGDEDPVWALERKEDRAIADGDYLYGVYVARCTVCNRTVPCDEPELLRARGRAPIPAEAVAEYLRKAPTFDEASSHRAPAHVELGYGFVQVLTPFLLEHATHALEAWVEARDDTTQGASADPKG